MIRDDDGLPRFYDDADTSATHDTDAVFRQAMQNRVYGEVPDDPERLVDHCSDQLGINLDDRHKRAAVRSLRDAGGAAFESPE